MKRNNSTIELLRIVLLFFLIATHWGHHWSSIETFFDTRIVTGITIISVSGFAMITGAFVYSPRKMVFRNVSRIIFIIIVSIVLAAILSLTTKNFFKTNLGGVLSGSRSSWYLYAILGVYVVGPLMAKYISRVKNWVPLVIGISIIVMVEVSRAIGPFSSLMYGNIFSFPMLFGLSLIGNSISRISWKRKTINISACALSVCTIAIIVVLAEYFNTGIWEHGMPTVVILAGSVFALAFYNPFHSKTINAIAKRLYFVYEFHWYWQYVWIQLFPGFIKDFPHLQLYVNWIVIFLFASIMSVFITEIQIRYWNKYVDPQMLKTISWTKSKLIKPKVSN